MFFNISCNFSVILMNNNYYEGAASQEEVQGSIQTGAFGLEFACSPRV